MDGSRLEVMKHLEGTVENALPELLYGEEEYWQPQDFLPDFQRESAHDELRDLQAEAAALPEDVLVTLVGDMVTEEALPSYSMWITQLDGFDRQGGPQNVWGEWLRRWTAEENRHGDVLNKYLYLTGRVNMREVEVTIQNLIVDGGDPQTGTDPFCGFVYTSFQEIATNVSHRNVASLAKRAGAHSLAKLCGNVASDENRHAKAYSLFFEKCLEADPNEAMLAFYQMMRRKITMPAMNMRERGAKVGDAFDKFSVIAERSGVYTRTHYTEIVERLVDRWSIAQITGLSGEAAKAQDWLCTLAARYRKIMERHPAVLSDERFDFTWLRPAEARV